MRKRNERVARLLAGAEIHQSRFAAAEPDRHAAVEGHVGQDELHFVRVEALVLEALDAPCHFLVLHMLHEARSLGLRHECRACGLERRVAEMVVAMEVAVDHPFDRLVGDLADHIEQRLAGARMGARIDDQHALVGDHEHCVRAAELVEEIEVVCDLLELGLRYGLAYLLHCGLGHDTSPSIIVTSLPGCGPGCATGPRRACRRPG